MNCYYESQIMIDQDSKLSVASEIAKLMGFDIDVQERILTRRTGWHREAKDAIKNLAARLQAEGVGIAAYRIADVLIDSDTKDMFSLLGKA